MGSGASVQHGSQELSSLNGAESNISTREQELQQALQDGKNLDEFSMLEIAKSKVKNTPPVKPCTKTKTELLKLCDESEEKIARQITKQIPSLLRLSSRELVNELTKDLSSDLGKVTAIYLFVASVDVGQIDSNEEPLANSPLEYLLMIKKYKANHAHLFCALCKIAGFPCEVIFGYNKSSSYQLGQSVEPEKMAAQWNAVYIHQEWRLVDCFWSSCCVVGGADEEEWSVLDIDGRTVSNRRVLASAQLTHRVNEFFFLTDPEKLIITHFPKKSSWQLLVKAHTIDQFEKSAYKRERFFELGLSIPSSEQELCKLVTDSARVSLKFLITDDSPSITFKYILYMARDESSDSQLDKFVLFQRSKGRIDYQMTIPTTGQFKIDIYGKDSRQHNSMDLVCSYVIVCTRGAADEEELPDNPEIGWGPHGGYLSAYGMEAVSHKEATICTDTGIVDIRYRLQGALELQSVLISNKHSNDMLDQHIYIEMNDRDCVVHIRIPEAGVYACKLFATEPGLFGPLQNVCNYVIKCSKPVNHDGYPYIPGGKLGLSLSAADLDISLFNPERPTAVTKDGKFKVTLKGPDGIQLYAALFHRRETQNEAAKHLVASSKDNLRVFDFHVQQAGLHCVSLWAVAPGQNRFHHIFNYMLDNQSQHAKNNDPVDLPEIEEVQAHNGKIDLSVDSSSSSIILPTVTKHYTSLDMNKCTVRVNSDGQTSTVHVKVREGGIYNLHLYEASASCDNGPVKLLRRFEIISSGQHEEDSNEVENIEEEAELVQEEVEVEEEATSFVDNVEGRVQKKLLAAIKTEEAEKIEEAMTELTQVENLSQKSKNFIKKAERLLAILTAKKELALAAADQENIAGLEEAMEKAKSFQHHEKVRAEYRIAQNIVQRFRRLQALTYNVTSLDQRTISEIKSFAKPPKPVVTTMSATLLLLGNDKNEVKEWRQIVALMGKSGKESLKRRVAEFQLKNVRADVANSSSSMLQTYELNEVKEASTGAAAFYQWAGGMLDAFYDAQAKAGNKK